VRSGSKRRKERSCTEALFLTCSTPSGQDDGDGRESNKAVKKKMKIQRARARRTFGCRGEGEIRSAGRRRGGGRSEPLALEKRGGGGCLLAQKRVEVDTLAASGGVHRELKRAVVDVGVHPLRILPPLREQPPLEAHSKGETRTLAGSNLRKLEARA